MNADVEKAVEATERALDAVFERGSMPLLNMALIAQHLRDQEAEIARQYECIRSHGLVTRRAEDRAEKAEALLRECIHKSDPEDYFVTDLRDRITTHLGATHD